MRRALWCSLSLCIGAVGTGLGQLAPPGTGGVAALTGALGQLGANKRVLVIGAHPDDEDTELLALLSRRGPRENAGVLHSFTESAEYGRKAVDLGFRISFSGMITFRNAQNIRDAARGLPLDALLVETDSPYLAPEPYRGKRCEPAFVVETARQLAEVKAVPFDSAAEATTAGFDRQRFISDLPGQIAVFRGPILRSCETRGEAVREIRDTVVHELGHVLGLGDEEMPY